MATTVKVKKGDTLSEIAQDAGISLSALLKLNPQIKNKNRINPGQTITQQIAEVQPVATGKAFTKVEKDPALLGTEALRGHIDYKGNQGLLSQKVRRANRIEVDKTAGLNKVHEMMDTGVKWFFRGLVGTAQYKLERSPLWRQAFYKEVAGNANLLSEAEQTLLRSNIDRYVTKLNTDLMAVKDKEGRVIKEAKITAETAPDAPKLR
jgi:murein DD-endopeptidase MepM/ murein hydrolase activator NlpD